MKLSEAIKLIQDVNLSTLTAEQKEAVSTTRDVFKITTDPDELQAAGFDGDIIALAKTLSVSKPKPSPKSRAKAAKAAKASSSVKKAKASRKANAKPRPKPVAAAPAKKEEAVPKAPKKMKPAVEKPQKSVKATPKKEKGPTASDKAKEKALAEIKSLDKDIAAYRKRINDNSGIIDRLATSLVSQGKSVSATLGALPDKVREELLLKRRQKAILQRIVKRDASYFENAAKTLRKANSLPEGLENDLKSVSLTLSQLKDRTVQQRKETKEKNKGFLAKILS
ncbi:hypothetical protein FHS57_005133 [Runella defluvii]|uniref:Uncharacterized protein n=1 Tax=Runella defluvii TaxID=370973 RepID=A0A7W6ET14_9BACT|nr:hypothetical protein [Runella defluvii]MBB3841112.1 hypothetical protein [Runella defluvii]